MKSILTEYTGFCAVCGNPNVETHHLVYGRGKRELSDNDGLTIPLCRDCHEELHKKSAVAATFSKIIGQLAFEKEECAKGETRTDAREHFRKRYGCSYL